MTGYNPNDDLVTLSIVFANIYFTNPASILGGKVVICTEEYTSKTCGCCGVINKNLGSLKTFKCPSCGATIDRDVNGARNVLLKYITENKSQLDQADVGAYTQDTLL